MLIVVFWVVMPCSLLGGYQPGFYPKNGGTVFLQHTGNHLQGDTISQPRIPQLLPNITFEHVVRSSVL